QGVAGSNPAVPTQTASREARRFSLGRRASAAAARLRLAAFPVKSRRPDWSENQPCNEFRCGAVSSPTPPCMSIRAAKSREAYGFVAGSCATDTRLRVASLYQNGTLESVGWPP